MIFVDLNRSLPRDNTLVKIKLMHWANAELHERRAATDHEDFIGEVAVEAIDYVNGEIYVRLIPANARLRHDAPVGRTELLYFPFESGPRPGPPQLTEPVSLQLA